MGDRRRALRPSRSRRARDLTRRQGRSRADSSRRGRQRLRYGRGARHCGRAREAADVDRNIVFALWSGEEIGLVGSNAFTDEAAGSDRSDRRVPQLRHGRPHAEQRLAAQAPARARSGHGSSSGPTWPPDSISALQPDPYQPTDSSSFNQAGVASLFFTTGSHTDYHRPTDTADKINYEDLDRVVDFAAAITLAMANVEMPPQFTKVDPPARPAHARGRPRHDRHDPGLHDRGQGSAACAAWWAADQPRKPA